MEILWQILLNWYYLVRMVKEYTEEDKSNVEAIKEDGSTLFIDAKPVNLSMDKNYFNPSKSNKIYVMKSRISFKR